MLDRVVERAARAGLDRYEVSAFARPGHTCAHNLNYWRFGDYLGIGAGAHGKLSFHDRIVRQQRWREPNTYVERALAGQAVSNQHEVDTADLPFEFMLNALRLRQGVPLRLFAERTGQSWAAADAAFAKGESQGLLERTGDPLQPTIRATARGFDFLSDAQALFLRDDDRPSRSAA
jgi:coproporphyrinogen III oxidase-like Fe-S oxidoreductase